MSKCNETMNIEKIIYKITLCCYDMIKISKKNMSESFDMSITKQFCVKYRIIVGNMIVYVIMYNLNVEFRIHVIWKSSFFYFHISELLNILMLQLLLYFL